MAIEDVLRSVLALIFVIGLMLGCAVLVRRMGWLQPLAGPTGGRHRLCVEEALTLDARHRLLLVRADAARILVLLGPTGARILPVPGPVQSDPSDGDGEDAP
ncbi:MAG: hypothetical protein ACFB6R_09345 [Alphaproteobacteria bacterium]